MSRSDAPNAGDYEVLAFDCYGTLIDWGAGLVGYLQPLLLNHDAHVIDEFLLEFFADAEPKAQADGVRYADVLRDVLRRLGNRLGFTPSVAELDGFVASVGDWPAFEDTEASLRRLSERFDLMVVSNIDNALFAKTAEALGVAFAHVVTAQDVGVYKPNPRMFQAARTAAGDARVLHVAQSLFHDIAPASAFGWDTVHIRRARNAARAVDAEPTWAFDSLADFAHAVLP